MFDGNGVCENTKVPTHNLFFVSSRLYLYLTNTVESYIPVAKKKMHQNVKNTYQFCINPYLHYIFFFENYTCKCVVPFWHVTFEIVIFQIEYFFSLQLEWANSRNGCSRFKSTRLSRLVGSVCGLRFAVTTKTFPYYVT